MKGMLTVTKLTAGVKTTVTDKEENNGKYKRNDHL